MRYHLETIPVWDAVKRETECPLCELTGDLEQQSVSSMLGGAVMEPAQRVETNKLGFCAHHMELMYAEKNRLGLALMLHTHLGELATAQQKTFDALATAIKAEAGSGLFTHAKAALTHGGTAAQGARTAAEKLAEHNQTCFICRRIEENLLRYQATIVHMWHNEKEFAEALKNSKGFCFPHVVNMLNMAADQLNGSDLRDFLTLLSSLQKQKTARLLDELAWFNDKFDWRNQDKPWGNSKDALPRTVNMLRGAVLPDAKAEPKT